MTPQSGEDDYNSYSADSQARAAYSYDLAGRITGIEYFWGTLNGLGYDSERIWACDSTYDHPLSLKDSAGFFEPNSGGTGWDLQRRETYEYEDDTDYLSEVDYNFGALQNVSWTYDAAGNRASDSSNSGTWSYDNLNRMTASPMGSYTSDLAGNRLSGPSQAMSWDDINRLTLFGSDTSYTYRTDGMRVTKQVIGGASTRFLYIGQMPTETTAISGDAWGGIVNGLPNKSSCCATQGHISDDESGLVYMRARYYDKDGARFISVDPELQGSNWYLYVNNMPTCAFDYSGKTIDWQQLLSWTGERALVVGYLSSAAAIYWACRGPAGVFQSVVYSMVAVDFYGLSFSCKSPYELASALSGLLGGYMMGKMRAYVNAVAKDLNLAQRAAAFKAAATAFTYNLVLFGALVAMGHLD